MSQKNRYRAVLVAAIAVSVGGIIWAISTKHSEYGDRGGAIAVAVALVVFFLDRNYPDKLYKIVSREASELRKDLPEEERQAAASLQTDDLERRIATLEKGIKDIHTKVNLRSESQKLQTKYLVWATLIGTLVWGFGGAFAKALINR
ncbi:MAG: hypothetical protein JOY96_04190 [Verrucomicrobia bacterium]|nr:hypothetical protein [Verrucomicrobiota bacterium]